MESRFREYLSALISMPEEEPYAWRKNARTSGLPLSVRMMAESGVDMQELLRRIEDDLPESGPTTPGTVAEHETNASEEE